MNGFAGGIVGGAVVRLFLDSSQFNTAFKTAEANAKTSTGRMEGSFSKVGVAANAAFMLAQAALVAFVAKGVKGALELEGSFKRISAITPVDPKVIQGWRDQLMGLSNDTGVAVTELADALFFLASAGLKPTEVMDALEAAAMGASAGLGATADVAKVTAYVLSAYSDAGMKAADVTDTLVAAVAAGNVEPEEFAGALGKVIPIAEAAGITFQEVAASLAVLSQTGLDASEGVTAFRGLVSALEAPGTAAAKAIESLGYSTDQVRQIIKERGALAAIRELWQASGQNLDVFKKIVPNVRALTGALSLTGQEAEKVDGVFRMVTESADATSKAFQIAGQNAEEKIARAFNRLTNAGIEIGQKLVPVLTVLAEALGFVAGYAEELLIVFIAWKAYTWLPDMLFAMARGLTRIGATAAADALMGAAAGAEAMGASIHTALPELLLIAAAIATAFSLWKSITQSPEDRLAGQIERDRELFDDLTASGKTAAEAWDEVKRRRLLAAGGGIVATTDPAKIAEVEDYMRRIQASEEAVAEAADTAAMSLEQFVKQTPNLRGLHVVADMTGQSFRDLATQAKAALGNTTDAEKAWGEFTEKVMNDARTAIAKWTDDTASKLNFVAQTFSSLAGEGETSVSKILTELKKAYTAQQEFGTNLQIIQQRSKDLGLDARSVIQTFIDAGSASAGTVSAIAKAGTSDFKELLTLLSQANQDAMTTTERLQRKMVGTLKQIRDILAAIAGTRWEANLKVNVNADQLLALKRLLEKVGVNVTTVAQVYKNQQQFSDKLATGGVIAAANGIVSSPTYLVGEGSYGTRFGTGAELVQPLNEQMLSRLGAAIGQYSVKVSGPSGGNTTIVNVDAAISPMDVAQNIEWWRRTQGR